MIDKPVHAVLMRYRKSTKQILSFLYWSYNSRMGPEYLKLFQYDFIRHPDCLYWIEDSRAPARKMDDNGQLYLQWN